MNRDEVRKLIGGYATGTLTDVERKMLFDAALEDQDLFDQLAQEQELKDLLETPGVRGRMIAALEPAEPRAAEAPGSWWTKSWRWAGAAALASAAVIAVVLLRAPEPLQIAALPPAPPTDAVSDSLVARPNQESAPAERPAQLRRAVQPAEPAAAQPVSKRKASSVAAAQPVAKDEESDRREAPAPVAETQQAQARAQQQNVAPPASQFAAPQAVDSLADQRRDQQPQQAAAARSGARQAEAGAAGGAVAGALETRALRVQVQAAPTPPPPPPKAAANAIAAKPPAAALNGSAFTYAVAGDSVRVTPSVDGFFQMTVRGVAPAASGTARRLNRGVATTFAIPPGASSILLSFSTADTAALAKSESEAAPAVLRNRSGTVEFPNASASAVSVEIPLQ